MLERLGEGVEFVRTHAQCAAGAAPCRYRALDFANDTARSGSGETEVGGNRHQGIDGCIGAAVFGNPGLELSRSIGERSDTRRVGRECVSTGRCRRSPVDTIKKKKT